MSSRALAAVKEPTQREKPKRGYDLEELLEFADVGGLTEIPKTQERDFDKQKQSENPGKVGDRPLVLYDERVVFSDEDLAKLEKYFLLKKVKTKEKTSAKINGIIKELQAGKNQPVKAIITSTKLKINNTLLDGLEDIDHIVTAASGEDHVSISKEDLAQMGIESVSFPGCNAESVAHHVLSIFCDIEKKGLLEKGGTLEGKTVGIIGYGQTGTRVARNARALGAKVLVNDPPLNEKGELDIEHTELKELLEKSDIVSLHVPLTELTRNLINHNNIYLLKGDILINSARGDVVDNRVLMSELTIDSTPKIKVYIDVWKGEEKKELGLIKKPLTTKI